MDPLKATHRLGSIVGDPSFEHGLQMYTTALMGVVTDLHRNGVYDFRVRVVTGDTIELTFENPGDATMFKLRWS